MCLVAGSFALGGGGAIAAAQEQASAALPAAPIAAPEMLAPIAAEAQAQAFLAVPTDPSGELFVLPDGWEDFFAAGYDYDDAVAIAEAWGSDATVEEIKATAGLALRDGQTLPIAPGSGPAAPELGDPSIVAFFNAGYDYDDALELAELWGVDSVQAKVAAGEKLLVGQTLPVVP